MASLISTLGVAITGNVDRTGACEGRGQGKSCFHSQSFYLTVGHVWRAKVFTVRGKAADGNGGCMGYVTMGTMPEAELAVLRTNKTAFKGAVISVYKVIPSGRRCSSDRDVVNERGVAGDAR